MSPQVYSKLQYENHISVNDFSINADYVAQYALKLAQHVRANLLVCKVYPSEDANNYPEGKMHSFSRAEEDSIHDLGAVVADLKTSLDKSSNASDFRPDTAQCSEPGAVDTKLNELSLKHNILMAVISTHSANNLSGDFRKNHAWAIIEKTGIPVLVIPYQVRFKPFGAIAFASAKNYTDITILESLTRLANYSSATVVVAHVTAETSDDPQEEAGLKAFFTQIPEKINYSAIQYRNIKGKNVARSLRELTAYIDIDLLVLVHRRRSSLQQLFSGSIARKLLTRPYKPLLIFPWSTVKESMVVF